MSSSSEDFSPRRAQRYVDKSHLLKRRAVEFEISPPVPCKKGKDSARPSCSHWDTPEQSSSASSDDSRKLTPKRLVARERSSSNKGATASGVAHPAPSSLQLAPATSVEAPKLPFTVECPLAPVHQQVSLLALVSTAPPERPLVPAPPLLLSSVVSDIFPHPVDLIQSKLDNILSLLQKVPPTAQTTADLTLSPVSSEEEVVPEQDAPSSVYSALLRFLLATYPSFFSPATPSVPASTFFMEAPSVGFSKLPNLVLSSSAKKELDEVEGWFSEKREQSKAVYCFPPSKLSRSSYRFYATGEAPSLGVSAFSQGDFSGLIDSTRRSAFSSAKIFLGLGTCAPS